MNPYLVHDLAIERQREAHRRAVGARLVALARCCKPSELSRLIDGMRVRFARALLLTDHTDPHRAACR